MEAKDNGEFVADVKKFLEDSSEPLSTLNLRALLDYKVKRHKLSATLRSHAEREGLAKYRKKGARWDDIYWGLAEKRYGKEFERMPR